jgi:hypothetical protein
MSLQLNGDTGVTFNDASLQGAAASPYVLKNRIINGAMQISQRGTSFTVDGVNTYSLDRWQVEDGTDGVFTVAQSSDAPSGFINSLLVTVTTADASIGATQVALVRQRIEGLNATDLAWGTANAQTVTLSFWVKSSLTGTFGGAILNSAANRSYPYTYTISSANTWEKKSITIAGDTSGTWLYDNGIFAQVDFSMAAGSTYLGTANAWAGTLYLGATGQTQIMSTLSATWRVTGVQFEIGTSATPFERRLYNQELANCQRYFLKLGGDSLYTPYGTGNNYSTVGGTMMVNYPVSMRTSPTLTATGPNRVLSGSVNTSVTSLALGISGVLGSYIDYQSTGLTQGHGSLLTALNSTVANFSFSAEL